MNCPICNTKIIKNPSQTYVIYCSDECKKKGKKIKNRLWYENNISKYKEYSKKNAEQKKIYLKEKYKSDSVFRELRKQKARRRYHLNKELIKSKVNEYRLKNKNVIDKKKRIWNETTGYGKLYYKKNAEKKKAHKRAYIKTEKGRFKTNFWNANRRAMLKNVIHKFTKEEWALKLKNSEGKCVICNEFIGITKLTLDHIYPLSKANEDYKLTGVKRIYYINDIQPVCKSCNSSKKDKLNLYDSPLILISK